MANSAFVEYELAAVRAAGPAALAWAQSVEWHSRATRVIWGCLVRQRRGCAGCEACVDKLDWRTSLMLIPGDVAEVELSALWEQCFAEEELPGTACPCVDSPELGVPCGTRNGLIRLFLEREPPVLVLQINRRSTVAGRNGCRVCFPERVEFCRSGPYRLLGVAWHLGQNVESGHYAANVWLGRGGAGQGLYGEYDDASEVREHAFGYLCQTGVRVEVVALVYVRERYWSDLHGDGIQETPYARDPGSVAVTEGLFRDLEARADTGDRRRPREVSPVRPALRASLYEGVVQTHSAELERSVAVRRRWQRRLLQTRDRRTN